MFYYNLIHQYREDESMNLAKSEWYDDVYNCVKKIRKDVFTLNDIYEYKSELSQLHPDNHEVEAKIRQQLQILRNQGKIVFVDNNGTYKKI